MQTCAGEECHGSSAAPALANPAAVNFMPTAIGGRIDALLPVTAIIHRHVGAVPDLRAVARGEWILAAGFD